MIDKCSMGRDLAMGNTLADAMANRASNFAELLPIEAKPVLGPLSLLQAV